jgi:hypothetical protein
MLRELLNVSAIVVALNNRALLGRQFVEATFEMISAAFRFPAATPRVAAPVPRESAFKQGLPALASLNPLLGLVQRKPASPRREWLVRIIRQSNFLPKRQCASAGTNVLASATLGTSAAM